MNRWTISVILTLTAIFGCREPQSPPVTPDSFSLTRGSGEFAWATPDGAAVDELQILYYIPESGDIADLPVLFIFHGADRNAGAYRENWKDIAETRGCMVFIPEFTDADYPGSVSYQQGSLIAANGSVRPEEERLFSLIEPLFDDIVGKLGVQKSRYDMWGHSAGAQFVHRFVLFAGDVRLRKAVAANAGWYTVPEEGVDFPYGLSGSPVSEADLGLPFSLQLIVHLGTEDTGFNDTAWEGAFAQGDNRFDRGHYFFDHATAQAANLGLPCAWQLQEVSGVGHDPQGMADAAAVVLYP